MSAFQFIETPLAGLVQVRRTFRSDNRGHLVRMFCGRELAGLGWDEPVAQSNLTLTRRAGTVRGMHFQRPPHGETKLVTCVRGRVFDVAVDLRRGSATFGQWFGTVLDAKELVALNIPKGFAHGFQALTDDAEMLYFHSAEYAPDHEGGLNPLDQATGIAWPLPITEMSERDAALPGIADLEPLN